MKNDAETLKKSVVSNARRIVIKVGSAVVQSPYFIERLASLFARLQAEGRKALVVSSGAFALGVDLYANSLNTDHRKKQKISLSQKRAFASIGQVYLMQCYRRAFQRKGIIIGQILLSKFSIDHRPSYINARHTLAELWNLGAAPVINENDSLATDELRFGDNDVLGALVCGLADADLYVMLSDVDGFYVDGKKISLTRKLTAEQISAAKGPKSSTSSGGMITKLSAVNVNTRFFIPTLLSNGREKRLYNAIFQKASGSMFLPSSYKISSPSQSKETQKPRPTPSLNVHVHVHAQNAQDGLMKDNPSLVEESAAAAAKKPDTKAKKDGLSTKLTSTGKISSRKRWLFSNVYPTGSIVIDTGAVAALRRKKSLLPGGIVAVKNVFRAGDVCNIVDENKDIIARGLSNYDSKDLQKIKGLKSSASKEILAESSLWHEEAVHRNNLVVLSE